MPKLKCVRDCPLCGNPIHSTHDECQCGGPQPDGCVLAQYGVREALARAEKNAARARSP